MGGLDWPSFVAGAGLTWLLILLVVVMDEIVGKIRGEGPKDQSEPAETAGRMELIDIDVR